MLGDNNRLIVWALDPTKRDGPIQARRLELGRPLDDGFICLALRPDGGLLAVGDRSGNVTLLDTARLRVVGAIKPVDHEAEGSIFAMAFSPDGRTLAVGAPQGQIFLWSVADVRSPRLGLRLPGQRGLIAGLAFDPQGHCLASAAGFEALVEIWDLDLLKRELARLGLAE
jgi:WD40 repeat protein